MFCIHASNALLSLKVFIINNCYCPTSNVLSPATLRVLPLKGTSIDAILDAGSAAALQRN
jgi:hypothetical protein